MSKSEDRGDIGRREFLRRGIAVGTGAGLAGVDVTGVAADPSSSLGADAAPQVGPPTAITSHPNETGRIALDEAWVILGSGGSALDSVEAGANVIELDPEDLGVGYGGLPNAAGVVQLDASVMDGRTYSAGAVGALERIRTPSSVARIVMERTDHVFLVGDDALAFALSFGFEEQELLTDRARAIWLRWREERGPDDDFGSPDHLRGTGLETELPESLRIVDGTTNVLALDANGDVAGITTTSGLSWKVPGRVGDSPIIGAGLYVDNSVGAAGATGRGEDVMKSCASYYIVMRMRDGRSPQEACEDALQMILERYRAVGLAFVPGEKFVALNRAGEVGCARMGGSAPARMTVRREAGVELVEGSLLSPTGD